MVILAETDRQAAWARIVAAEVIAEEQARANKKTKRDAKAS